MVWQKVSSLRFFSLCSQLIFVLVFQMVGINMCAKVQISTLSSFRTLFGTSFYHTHTHIIRCLVYSDQLSRAYNARNCFCLFLFKCTRAFPQQKLHHGLAKSEFATLFSLRSQLIFDLVLQMVGINMCAKVQISTLSSFRTLFYTSIFILRARYALYRFACNSSLNLHCRWQV